MSFADFSGRTIVLTGVGRRGQAGEAVAALLASSGARLALLDRDGASVKERAAELRAPGGVEAYACDLADPTSVSDVAGKVGKFAGGGIDAVVNIAGGFAMSGPVADSDPAVLDRQIAINLKTALNTTRAFLPLVRERRGSLVYFASAAVLPDGSAARMSAYAASKAGVLALMRAVAQEELENGVRANAVAPTAIRTTDNLKAMGEKIRYVEREDVAAVVAFLCSDASRAITGQVFRLA